MLDNSQDLQQDVHLGFHFLKFPSNHIQLLSNCGQNKRNIDKVDKLTENKEKIKT